VAQDRPKFAILESKYSNEAIDPTADSHEYYSMSSEELTSVQCEWLNHQTLNLTEYFCSLSEYEAFSEDINPTLAPDYDLLIGININLKLMKDRSQNCYYRQPQAYLGDARTIFLNAVFFNGVESPLALRAGELYRAVLKALSAEFPMDDFKDYIAFDECLRDMVPVRSLLTNNSGFVTAAIDEGYCHSLIQEYDTISKHTISANNLKLNYAYDNSSYRDKNSSSIDKISFSDDNHCDQYDSDDEVYLYLTQENFN
jgi:hypothetical protein